MVIFITSTDDGGGKRSMREEAFLYKICPGLGRGYSIVRTSKKIHGISLHFLAGVFCTVTLLLHRRIGYLSVSVKMRLFPGRDRSDPPKLTPPKKKSPTIFLPLLFHFSPIKRRQYPTSSISLHFLQRIHIHYPVYFFYIQYLHNHSSKWASLILLPMLV